MPPRFRKSRSSPSTGANGRLTFLALLALFGCAIVMLLSLVAMSLSSASATSQQHTSNDQFTFTSPIQQALHDFRIPLNNNNNKNDLDHWYPREEALPNPPPADGHNTFSACLLVMDDNHRLTEWLAYHYHVLPLRYIVMTADPRSKTSPSSILNAWRKRGVVIEEWVDRDFWKKDLKLAPIPDDAKLQTKRDRHRGRQKYFYRRCLIHLKKQNRTWVSLHDTDEYLVYNHAGGEKYEAWEKEQTRRHNLSQLHGNKQRIQPSKTPPTTAQEGGMIEYIRQEQKAGLDYYKSPCIGIPRLTFGAEESSLAEQQQTVPESLRSLVPKLDTLRWRKHAPRNDFVKNALGKVLIDVSRIDMEKTPQFMSLHRPIKKLCTAPWHNDWESGLRINHYLGSWESYSFRDDARRGFERSREQWEYKSSTNADMTDDNIRPWISGLVESHGVDEAQEFLKGVGLPDGYQPTNDGRSWNLLPDKLEEILAVDETDTNDGKKAAFDMFVRQKYKGQKMQNKEN